MSIRRYTVGFALLAACLAALPSLAAADESLRWKFTPGEKLHYIMDMEMKQTMTIGGMPVNMTTNQTMDMTWSIEAVDDQGQATVLQTIERIRMKMKPAQGDPLEYDSDSKEKPAGPFAAATKLFDAMVKKPSKSKMDPRGQTSAVELPEGLNEALKQLSGAFGGAGDGMKNLTGAPPFPAEAMSVGHTWKNETTGKNPILGQQKVTTSYEYTGKEKIDGRELDKLNITIQMEFGGAENKNVTVNVKEQETKGALYFDNAAGRVDHADTTMKMKLQVMAAGFNVDQDLETTNRLRLAKSDK
jgi:hypothetical protein